MFRNLEEFSIVLASNSPRRQSLLKEMGMDFTVQSSKGEENYPDTLEAEKVAEYLAIQKADWFENFDNNELYITADTVVILDDQVLGKPKDETEAKIMLQKQSGRTHHVVTGICLKSKSQQKSLSILTEVTFNDLTDTEIDYYITTFKPFDKAGAYGIQEWIGMIGISGIKGSYFNVVGLPTEALFNALKMF
jgi:septum formation protein